MVVLSFTPLDRLLQDPGALWVPPSQVDWGTYATVLRSVDDGGIGFLAFMRNSFVVAIGTVVVSLLVSVPGAYAVSRLDFFGRRRISALFLAIYFFPAILLAVPLFIFFTRVGLRGSLVGLVIVYVAQVVAVSIYMLRNYFDTIPTSLEEAAASTAPRGCRRCGKIALPLAMPAIVSNALFIFMIAWNEFLFALLFLVEERSAWTVSLGLSQLSGSIEIPTTILMAGSVILTLPIVVLFFLSERLLSEGLTARGREGLNRRAAGRAVHRSPRVVELVACGQQPLLPGHVRVRTWYSGISAGTELTAYRGSNPYLTKSWDPVLRVFVEGPPTFAYPVVGWGYSEVGEVVEVADDLRDDDCAYQARRAGDDPTAAEPLAVGRRGPRDLGAPQRGRLPVAALAGRVLPPGSDPMTGVFARVGAIALNSVLQADVRLGEQVAVFGQGVIGLLADPVRGAQRGPGGGGGHGPAPARGGRRRWARTRWSGQTPREAQARWCATSAGVAWTPPSS